MKNYLKKKKLINKLEKMLNTKIINEETIQDTINFLKNNDNKQIVKGKFMNNNTIIQNN